MDNYEIKNGVLVVKEGVTELPRNPWANNMIGEGFFQDNLDIVEAKLPSTLKSIGDWAFLRCKNLKKIEIPNSVTKLENFVFAECESLEEIVVPDSVSKMQTSNFEKCKNLKKVKLSKKIKEIPPKTFAGCESLEEVIYSDNLTKYDSRCFSGCKSLKELNIPKKVAIIESDAFEGCSALEKITVNKDNERYSSVEGSNAVFEGKKLIIGCKNTIIPEGTTSICKRAFAGCSDLKSITVPEGVIEIERDAFKDCINLEKIYLPSTLEKIADCFEGCNKLSVIHVDKNNKNMSSGKEDNLLVNNNKLVFFVGTDIPSNEGFEEIDENAINKPGITELIIPEGVKKLGGLNFYTEETTRTDKSGKDHLESKEFPLKKLSIPSTLKEIDKEWLKRSDGWNIEDIDEIIVSDKNDRFDSRNGCNAIIDSENNALILGCKNTTIPDGVEIIDGRMISGTTIEKLTIPKSVRHIKDLICKVNELVIFGDDVEIGEVWQSGYEYDPFSTRNVIAKKITAPKSVIEKLEKLCEKTIDAPEFIEL